MKQTLSVARRARPHVVLTAVAVAVAALALMAAGCDWAQPPAASVNGFHISRSSFLDQIGSRKKGQPVDATKAAGFLTLRIRYAYFDEQAKKLGVTPSASTIKQYRTQVDQSQYAGAPVSYKNWLAKAAAEQQAVATHFNQIRGPQRTAFERQLYDQQGKNTAQLCFHAIVTADNASATQAKTRIGGGASFESVASQVSIDSTGKSQGGNYGCTDASQLATSGLPTALASALQSSPIGQVFGPLSFTANTGQTAYVIGKVDRRGAPTFAQYQQQNDSQFGQAYAADQATRVLRKSRVHVDPQFGTWNKRTLQVDPPKGVPSKMAPPTSAPNSTVPQLGTSTGQGGTNG